MTYFSSNKIHIPHGVAESILNPGYRAPHNYGGNVFLDLFWI